MLVRRLVCLCVLFLASVSLVYADTKTLTADASYLMGDGETPDFAEARALQKAKQTALEEAGTYVESYTKAQNLDVTAEEIQTVAGGVLQVEVLEKTRSLVADGLRFYTKINATVTTDKMEELTRRIKGKNVAQEYTQLQAEYARLSRELDRWKQRAAQTPQGQERDAALDQIREEAKAFARVQQREGEFFQRLVSGKQLVESGSRDKEIIDGLLKMIAESGFIVTVGEIHAVAVSHSSEPIMFAPYVPVTIRVSETLREAVSHAVRALDGTIRPDVEVRLQDFTDTGAQPLRIGKDTRSKATVTLVRLGKYLETANDFQDKVMKLALLVEFLDGTSTPFSCYLGPSGDRYHIDGVPALDFRGKDWPSWEEAWFPLRRIFPVSSVVAVDALDRDLEKTLQRLQELEGRSVTHEPAARITNGEYDEAHLCKKEKLLLGTSLFIECRFPRAEGGTLAGKDIPSKHGYVVIVRDEASFVARLPFVLTTNQLRRLTGVRVRTVSVTALERFSNKSDDPITSCLIVQ